MRRQYEGKLTKAANEIGKSIGKATASGMTEAA